MRALVVIILLLAGCARSNCLEIKGAHGEKYYLCNPHVVQQNKKSDKIQAKYMLTTQYV